MVLASLSVRMDPGAFSGSSTERAVAQFVGRINSTVDDPRCGVRVVLHLRGGTPDESQAPHVAIVYRRTPHEMVRVDWPCDVPDGGTAACADHVRAVLEDVVLRVAEVGDAQGFGVDTGALMAALASASIAPADTRVVDHMTTRALQVLWAVRRGGGAWDARLVHLDLEWLGGNVEGGIMPELRYLASQDCVARHDEFPKPLWSILPKGERLIEGYDHLP